MGQRFTMREDLPTATVMIDRSIRWQLLGSIVRIDGPSVMYRQVLKYKSNAMYHFMCRNYAYFTVNKYINLFLRSSFLLFCNRLLILFKQCDSFYATSYYAYSNININYIHRVKREWRMKY